MAKITPVLWFEDHAEEAAKFYVSLFPNSRLDKVSRAPADTPSGPAGSVLTVDFTLDGQPVQILNGGPEFKLSEAFSLAVDCKDQAEVDRLWNAFLDDGGQESVCGWLKDRYGLSWQIVPHRLGELLADPDPGRAQRAMEAMLKMVKIDVAELERAADAVPVG